MNSQLHIELAPVPKNSQTTGGGAGGVERHDVHGDKNGIADGNDNSADSNVGTKGCADEDGEDWTVVDQSMKLQVTEDGDQFYRDHPTASAAVAVPETKGGWLLIVASKNKQAES